MVQEINSEKCKVTFDVANAHVVEPPAEAIERIGKYLAFVHLSDNDGKNWAHLEIGKGTIDFQSVANVLNKINYTGVSVYEPAYEGKTEDEITKAKEKLEKMGWAA
jgi:sugar phosphate isomerase/epimerase